MLLFLGLVVTCKLNLASVRYLDFDVFVHCVVLSDIEREDEDEDEDDDEEEGELRNEISDMGEEEERVRELTLVMGK